MHGDALAMALRTSRSYDVLGSMGERQSEGLCGGAQHTGQQVREPKRGLWDWGSDGIGVPTRNCGEYAYTKLMESMMSLIIFDRTITAHNLDVERQTGKQYGPRSGGLDSLYIATILTLPTLFISSNDTNQEIKEDYSKAGMK